MGVILDADVIIRAEKGMFDIEAWFESRADDSFEVAAVTIAELWHGVERATGRQRNRREQYLRGIVGPLTIVPYTEQTAYVHARLWAQLKTSGSMTGYYDLIVAATAIERGSEVATFNRRHFARVPGLTVIDPK